MYKRTLIRLSDVSAETAGQKRVSQYIRRAKRSQTSDPEYYPDKVITQNWRAFTRQVKAEGVHRHAACRTRHVKGASVR